MKRLFPSGGPNSRSKPIADIQWPLTTLREKLVKIGAKVGRDFAMAASRPERLVANGETWCVEEEALAGPNGERLARLPGHIAYWFAWSGFKAGAPLYGN